MNDSPQNPLGAPVFQVPDPAEEFGQDGGKFYRSYDGLADEVDEDMVKGLKEQLDGLLIFAGLFAGVNTAFLALTLPKLSPDPADDITVLLVQNTAILAQLVTGNNTFPPTSSLPSTGFSPSRDIFAVNALFSLSLAFAIISSFLAVLGRQWLVYYRKRSGGGPDRQRWEQLKRFLAAERWKLEPMLDDVLPSLLQLGLIIFCISLIIYLHYLSPAISIIVEIPMCMGFAFFIGSALCTVWDKFCPFHSPLSHVLFWSARTIPPTLKTVKELKWKQLVSPSSMRRWISVLAHGRTEETLESLQVIALQRAICTSDDSVTLLSATANILAITDAAQMDELWSDRGFQERFFKQLENSYSRMLQLRGRDQINIAAASQRLYSAAATHIAFFIDLESTIPYGSSADIPPDWAKLILTLQGPSILIPGSQLPELPPCLIRSSFFFALLQSTRDQYESNRYRRETLNYFRDQFVPFVLSLERQDWTLFYIVCYMTCRFDHLREGDDLSIVELRDAYQGGKLWACNTLAGMLYLLTESAPIPVPRDDRVLSNLLAYADQIISDKHSQVKAAIDKKFYLLQYCERALPDPRYSTSVRSVVKKIRSELVRVCQKQCENPSSSNETLRCIVDPLKYYLAEVRTIHQGHNGYHESLEILRVFSPLVRKVVRDGAHSMWQSEPRSRLASLRQTFNDLVLDIDRTYRQIQNNARQIRGPDERWCHWEGKKLSIMNIYSIRESSLLLATAWTRPPNPK